jgi:large subunit ribosomal protein L22
VARARTEPQIEEPQEVRASGQYLRITPRKARLVVDHIRGRTVPEARTVLAFTPRAAAREIEKVLASAVANAEANHGLIGDELVITSAYVDEGPVIKRWRARARGRVARIKKRTCHVTLRLQPLESDGDVRRPRRQQQAEAPAVEEEQPKAEETKPKRPARRRTTAKAETTETKPKPTRSRKKPDASDAKEEE